MVGGVANDDGHAHAPLHESVGPVLVLRPDRAVHGRLGRRRDPRLARPQGRLMAAVRYLSLLVPVAGLALAVLLTKPDLRTRGAALFGGVAAAIGLTGLNAIAG